MNILKGKKTYLVAIAWAATILGQQFGVLDPSQVGGIQAILAPLGLATLRKGVSDSK